MRKLFQKTVVSLIAISFVFNSGMNQIVSYAKTIDVKPVFEVAKSVLTDFVVKDGVLEKYKGSDKIVKIPKDVTCIGEGAFKDNDKIEEVVLSENIESIEKASFKNCKNLKKISFDEDLDSIGDSAFEGCKNLKMIVIPEDVSQIGKCVFKNCKSLEGIVLPNALRCVEKELFENCENLKAITIPQYVESIEGDAFKGCKSLESLVILNKYLEFDFSMLKKPKNIVFYGKKDSKLEKSAKEKDYKFEEIVLCGNISFDKSELNLNEEETSKLEINVFPKDSNEPIYMISDDDEVVEVVGNNKIKAVEEGTAQISLFTTQSEVSSLSVDVDTTDELTPEDSNTTENNEAVNYANVDAKNVSNVNSATDNGGFTYQANEGEEGISIKGYTGTDTEIVIPSEIDGMKVTAIGYGAFGGNSSLTSITIPEGVTYIGWNAFYNCTSLKTITIPESVTTIDIYAFYNCKSLESITIPKGMTTIGEYTFYNCRSLKSITIPESVTTIGQRAFYYCSSLTSITIPEGVTTIEQGTFSYCEALTSITIPKNVTAIGEDAFEGCKSLTSITIPDGITTIESYTFDGCSGLTSITIPESVTTIGYCAIRGCSGLTSITIPESVTTIESSAFSGCSGLTSITLPKSITTIASSVFRECSGLTSITIPESVTTIKAGAFAYSGLTGITIPKGITTIEQGTFEGCSGLTSITIPENITTIGEKAFAYSGLTSITIPKSITTINKEVFSNCYSLTSVTIPESVTNIGEYAFAQSGLTSVTIPKSVTNIGERAFYYCLKLTSVTIPEGVETIGKNAFLQCMSLTNIIIPESVTTIGIGAFAGCSELTSITIPESITTIEAYTFNGCKSLTSITIPESVTTIGKYAFEASGLISIIIPESVTTIEEGAFYDCGGSYGEDGLTSVTLPKGITTIEKKVFCYCNRLTSITIPEDVTIIGENAFNGCSGLTNITIPECVETIGDGAFASCTGLTSITIPESLQTIGAAAFAECWSLTSITIPKSVQTIDAYTFEECIALESITIPEGVTTVGTNAFYKCTNLIDIYMPHSIDEMGDSVFNDCTNLTMHVYKGTIAETYAIENNIPYKYRDYEDAIVILPGAMGSRLFRNSVSYDQESVIWDPQVIKDDKIGTYVNFKVLSRDLLHPEFVRVKPPQNQQFLIPHGWDDKTDFGLEYREYGALDVYRNLVNELCLSTDRPVYFFSYNWMQSNEDTAEKLKAFLEPFDQVDLVCHSMGGIVASKYMSKYQSDGKVDRIITCGTPYEGAPVIINKTYHWDILEDNDNFVFTDSTLKNVFGDVLIGLAGGLDMETKVKIPAMAELVPTVNYVSEIPMKIRDSLAGRELSVEEYVEVCQNIYKETYVDALGFQESIHGDSGYNVLLDYDKAYFLIGTNEKTIARIMFTTLEDNHMNFYYYEDDLHYDTTGDGTVPYMSASIMKKIESLPLERKFIIKDTDHQETVQNDIPIRWIKGKLGITGKSQTTYGTRESVEELVSDEVQGHDHMVFRIACPVDVNVESNGEALNSSIKRFDAKTSFGRLDLIGQNSDIKMLCVDTSDDYDVTLDGTGEGTMDYTVRYFNSEDKLQDETTIKDVPITENTIIKTHPVATEDMVLEVDSDGDGTVDKTYTAPKGETVDVQNTVKFNPNNGDQVITRAVDSDGKLNYTPEAPTSEGYTFVGWFKDTDDITTEYKSGDTYTEDVTYTAKWAHVDMLGAQVKAVVDDKSGIRFGTKIYDDGDEIVEKGTIILPAKLLPDGEKLTLDTPKIARSVGKVNYDVNEEENYVTYLGTLVGIPSAQFDAEITASAYVIYKDKAGNEYTVYAPYKNGSTTINKLLNS